MNTPIPTLNELSNYYNRKDLLEKVVNQIKKDFDWFSFEIQFTGKEESAYVELFQQI